MKVYPGHECTGTELPRQLCIWASPLMLAARSLGVALRYHFEMGRSSLALKTLAFLAGRYILHGRENRGRWAWNPLIGHQRHAMFRFENICLFLNQSPIILKPRYFYRTCAGVRAIQRGVENNRHGATGRCPLQNNVVDSSASSASLLAVVSDISPPNCICALTPCI